MPTGTLNGTALGAIAAGSLLLYAGITGKSLLKAAQSIVQGSSPKNVGTDYPITGQDSMGGSAAPGGSFAGPSSGGGNAAQNQALAKQIATAMGHPDWTVGQQWADWVTLWNGESGWRTNATNPGSGAYGIPQALPADKMASAGSDWKTNPATQIKWGVGYIASVYGSPSAALAKWQSRSPHWY